MVDGNGVSEEALAKTREIKPKVVEPPKPTRLQKFEKDFDRKIKKAAKKFSKKDGAKGGKKKGKIKFLKKQKSRPKFVIQVAPRERTEIGSFFKQVDEVDRRNFFFK